jgi:hypothetical protein
MSVETWESALESRTDLQPYGDNSIGLFALALRFNLDDLASVAADAITDGSDDKKCDLIHIDRDGCVAVVAQCYMAKAAKPSAPANKASDLNTAVGWLLQTPLKKLPARIRSSATDLRNALSLGTVTELHFWYVHNLPESKNVRDEMAVVETALKTALLADFAAKEIRASAREVGSETLKSWYGDSLSAILVNKTFKFKVPDGFPMQSADWEALVTALPASFLHRVYRAYKTKLFSANVRDYLGSRKSDQNINFGIKQTADSAPDNFWVFNNGLTLLVNDFSFKRKQGGSELKIMGLSIVNGAQTTGALGSLKTAPAPSAYVPVRIIKTTNRDVIYDVIRYNNSQNKITAPDFRSTDRVQKRLKNEISKIQEAEYEGGRRGGHEDVIRRRANLLPSYTVGQALAAFHGDAVIAYNQKSEIWILDNLYARYFNDDTSGAHIVFSYALLRTVESRKVELLQKAKEKPDSLTATEQKQLEFFRNRGSTYLLVSAIAACIETFVGRRIPNLFRLAFAPSTSPSLAQNYWRDIVMTTVPLCTHLEDAFTDGLKNTERVRKAVETFQGLVQATESSNKKLYKDFANKVHTR